MPDIKHFDEMVLLRAQFPACAGKEVHCLFVVPLNKMVNAQIGRRLLEQIRFFERLKRRIPAGHDSVGKRGFPCSGVLQTFMEPMSRSKSAMSRLSPNFTASPRARKKEPGERRCIAARANDKRVHVTAKTPVPLCPIST